MKPQTQHYFMQHGTIQIQIHRRVHRFGHKVRADEDEIGFVFKFYSRDQIVR